MTADLKGKEKKWQHLGANTWGKEHWEILVSMEGLLTLYFFSHCQGVAVRRSCVLSEMLGEHGHRLSSSVSSALHA